MFGSRKSLVLAFMSTALVVAPFSFFIGNFPLRLQDNHQESKADAEAVNDVEDCKSEECRIRGLLAAIKGTGANLPTRALTEDQFWPTIYALANSTKDQKIEIYAKAPDISKWQAEPGFQLPIYYDVNGRLLAAKLENLDLEHGSQVPEYLALMAVLAMTVPPGKDELLMFNAEVDKNKGLEFSASNWFKSSTDKLVIPQPDAGKVDEALLQYAKVSANKSDNFTTIVDQNYVGYVELYAQIQTAGEKIAGLREQISEMKADLKNMPKDFEKLLEGRYVTLREVLGWGLAIPATLFGFFQFWEYVRRKYKKYKRSASNYS